MSRVRWLTVLGGLLCAYVALREFTYAHAHGPAINIALLACGGVALALAIHAKKGT
jgi:uncharacterized membrane protein YdcZ (DUF606 family)